MSGLAPSRWARSGWVLGFCPTGSAKSAWPAFDTGFVCFVRGWEQVRDEGRNLQCCRTIVNFDLPWNPVTIEQRVGRVHRIGQTRDVCGKSFCRACVEHCPKTHPSQNHRPRDLPRSV